MIKKRGEALMELVIVLAILGVVTIMVVSFTIITKGWVDIGVQRYQLTQDERTATRVLHNFVDAYDSEDYSFTAFSGSELQVLRKSDRTVCGSLRYDGEEGVLIAEYSNGSGDEEKFPVAHFTDLTVFIRSVPNSNDKLICCRVYYKLDATNTVRQTMNEFIEIVVAARNT